MVSGRNGVGFPIGPAALWWLMGLEVGPRVYLHMGFPERESVFEIGLFS